MTKEKTGINSFQVNVRSHVSQYERVCENKLPFGTRNPTTLKKEPNTIPKVNIKIYIKAFIRIQPFLIPSKSLVANKIMQNKFNCNNEYDCNYYFLA